MTVHFLNVNPEIEEHLRVLYQLLGERDPKVNISHTKLPFWHDHVAYVKSKPHKLWFIVYDETTPVGAMYLTQNNEIGTFTLKDHMRKGYATLATEFMKGYTGNETLYANVAPLNLESQRYCEKMGFKVKQWTYELKR